MATLDAVIGQLKENNETNKLIGSEVMGLRDQFSAFFERGKKDKLKGLEEGAENRKRFTIGSIFGRKDSADQEEGAKRSLLSILGGGLFSMIASVLGKPLGFILKPLGFLAKLLRVGGPIALVIGTLYALFNDIAEHPAFTTTMDALKKAWEDIKETWTNLKEKFETLSNDPGLLNAVEMIKLWFFNLKQNIQDFVLDTLSTIATTISGILDGIDLLLAGEWKKGLSTIGSSLFWGIFNLADSLFTNVLEIFGVDFGEDGTLFTWIGTRIANLSFTIKQLWKNFTTWIRERWDALVNFFVGKEGYVQTTYNNIKTTIKDGWTNFKNDVSTRWGLLIGFFTDPNQEGSIPHTVENIKTTVKQTLIDIKDELNAKWEGLKDTIVDWGVNLWETVTGWLPDLGQIVKDLKRKLYDLVPEWMRGYLPIDMAETTRLSNERGFDPNAAQVIPMEEKTTLRFDKAAQTIQSPLLVPNPSTPRNMSGVNVSSISADDNSITQTSINPFSIHGNNNTINPNDLNLKPKFRP